jgi:hypothetical protein
MVAYTVVHGCGNDNDAQPAAVQQLSHSKLFGHHVV